MYLAEDTLSRSVALNRAKKIGYNLPMILWGEIREFPLVSVLQFLAEQRRTGILEIQDFEELGWVYLSRGRVDAVSMLLWDQMFGNKLIAAGAVSEPQVKQCWMDFSNSEQRPVLAALLAAADEFERRELVEIVNRHVSDAIMQLMYWNGGTFRFSVPSEEIFFPVVPTLSVEALLLDAYRRVDEGERPWREKISHEQELCLTCTIDCTAQIKARYLKPDLCLWRSMPAVLKDPIYRGLQKLRLSGEEEDGGPEDLLFI
jgi:hypothetical protein